MFLVDGSYQAFRLHFAMPPRHTSAGFPTRVLYGFTTLFNKMLRAWQPDYVVVSFDIGASFRKDIYPDYKGHRPEMPEDLRQQWPLLGKIVEGFGYSVINLKGYEADDVLGTLAKRFASDELEVFLVTGDKDFCQLVDDNISIFDDYKQVTIDHDGVLEKFGVPPDKVIDILGLAGDKSDNIPGVTRIGVKTAAKYVAAYGSLEGTLEAAKAGNIKGKAGERLVEEADNAVLSKVLATIALDAPVNVDLDDLTPRGLQAEELRGLFDEWEFGAVARKLLPAQEREDLTAYRVASSIAEVQQVLSELGTKYTSVVMGADDEDGADPAPVGFALGGPQTEAVWVGLDDMFTRAAILDVMANASVPKIMYGAKRVYRSLARHGRGLEGVTGDLRVLDYVLAPHRRQHGLDAIASRHLAHTLGMSARNLDGLDVIVATTAERASVVARLHEMLEPKASEGQLAIYRDMELPLTPVLAELEMAGIRLDVGAISSVDEDIAGRLKDVEAECHSLAGRPFNVRSRHELRDVLFKELGLPPSKKVKDGWSTASSVLEKLVEQHPLPSKVLEYRSLDKLRSTYLTKLPTYIGQDGRIHTSFNQTVTATGRLSSHDPNLQNIPIRTFEGRRIRECFVPEPGHVFLSADYSQIELRVLAHYSQDALMLEGFRAGEDIHARTAVEVFGAEPGAVSVAQRSAAKAINFGLLYGMSAFRLAGELGISREQAAAYMDAYFQRMPKVAGWIESTKVSVREQGFVETMYGRRRLIPEIYAKPFNERAGAEREAVNTRIQGTAADLIKMAMLRVHQSLSSGGFAAKILLQVHDELLLEVPTEELDAVREIVVREMEATGDLDVPLVVNTAVGSTWNEAHG
jgi:DNA polymerase-1